jgi:hypothetical protein
MATAKLFSDHRAASAAAFVLAVREPAAGNLITLSRVSRGICLSRGRELAAGDITKLEPRQRRQNSTVRLVPISGIIFLILNNLSHIGKPLLRPLP